MLQVYISTGVWLVLLFVYYNNMHCGAVWQLVTIFVERWGGEFVCRNINSVFSPQLDECHLQFYWNIFQCQEQASYNLVKGRGKGE